MFDGYLYHRAKSLPRTFCVASFTPPSRGSYRLFAKPALTNRVTPVT